MCFHNSSVSKVKGKNVFRLLQNGFGESQTDKQRDASPVSSLRTERRLWTVRPITCNFQNNLLRPLCQLDAKKILIRDVREAFHLMHWFMIFSRVSVWQDCCSRSCSVNTLPNFLTVEFKVMFFCLTRIVWDRRRRESGGCGEGAIV